MIEKNGERWVLQEPFKVDADAPKVTELIDRIGDLQATGPDVLDANDLKAFALDAPTGPHVTLTIVQKDTPDLPQTLTLRVGKDDAEKKKLAVQVAGNPRVALVNDDFWKLFDRPPIAYRSKRVLDADPAKIATISVQRGGESFGVARKDAGWALTAPVNAPADADKLSTLSRDLSKLEAVDFVADAPKPDELARFGLDKPTASATFTFSDGSPAKTLQLGVGREGKPEVYAKLADAPQVFTVRTAVRDAIDQPSLAFRPLQIWQFPPSDVSTFEVTRSDETYKLSKAGSLWRLSGPFDGNASPQSVQPLLGAAATLRAERDETHRADTLAKYGLARPQLGTRRRLGDGDPTRAYRQSDGTERQEPIREVGR